jgi:hypothetical protein
MIPNYKQLKIKLMAVKEHYILLKGDTIIGNASTIEKIKEQFNATPPKKRILDGRAIYKLVMED